MKRGHKSEDTMPSSANGKIGFIIDLVHFVLLSIMFKRRNESGSCDLTVYQKMCAEYAAEYDHDFTFESCRVILRDHSAWKQVEKPLFYSKQNKGSKKAKTSETTLGSAQGGLNLNKESDGFGEEGCEVRPIGRGPAKKKAYASSRLKSSFVAGRGLVDFVTDKWKSLESVGWGKRRNNNSNI
ncbi:hypothetical protein Tco_1060977 [Tanacetum coccineum]